MNEEVISTSGFINIQGFDCTNPYHIGNVVGKHEIEENDLNIMVRAFFYPLPTPFPPTKFDQPDIDNLIKDLHCLEKMAIEGADDSVNNDITIVKSVEKRVKAYYSVALFMGIKAIYSPHHYEFFKARRGIRNTIVLIAYDINDIVLYCGDLSHMHP